MVLQGLRSFPCQQSSCSCTVISVLVLLSVFVLRWTRATSLPHHDPSALDTDPSVAFAFSFSLAGYWSQARPRGCFIFIIYSAFWSFSIGQLVTGSGSVRAASKLTLQKLLFFSLEHSSRSLDTSDFKCRCRCNHIGTRPTTSNVNLLLV